MLYFLHLAIMRRYVIVFLAYILLFVSFSGNDKHEPIAAALGKVQTIIRHACVITDRSNVSSIVSLVFQPDLQPVSLII